MENKKKCCKFYGSRKSPFNAINSASPRPLAKIDFEVKLFEIVVFKTGLKMFSVGLIKILLRAKLVLNRIVYLYAIL